MAIWRRRPRCRDLTGPATVYLARSGAYTSPTWADQSTLGISTVGLLTRGQATGYTTSAGGDR